MNYYRKSMNKLVDNIKYKFQIAALTLKVDENISNIKSLKDNDNTNENNISYNTAKIENISSNLIKEIFNENYIIKDQKFNFNANTHFFNIFEVNLENDFKIGDIIEITANIFYKYNNINNNYHRLEHEYNMYSDNISFFKRIIEHKQFYINETIIMREKFEIPIENDFKNLTIKILLYRIKRKEVGNIILEIPERDNFFNIIHLNKSIDFSIIEKNRDNISSNLMTINNISNNIYLKNVYNILFYDKKLKLNLMIYFMKNHLKLTHL